MSEVKDYYANRDAYWAKLVRQYGDAFEIALADDGVPLFIGEKANLLYYRLCNRYFEAGEEGAAYAMKAVDKYLAATGIDRDDNVKGIRQLFEVTVNAAANGGPDRDVVQSVCTLVAIYADHLGMAHTSVRVTRTDTADERAVA